MSFLVHFGSMAFSLRRCIVFVRCVMLFWVCLFSTHHLWAERFVITNFSGFAQKQSNMVLSESRLYAFWNPKNRNASGSVHYGFDFLEEMEQAEEALQLQFNGAQAADAVGAANSTAEIASDGFIGRALRFSSVNKNFYLQMPFAFIESSAEYTGDFSIEIMAKPDAALGEMHFFSVNNTAYSVKKDNYRQGVFIGMRNGVVVAEFENFFHFQKATRSIRLSDDTVVNFNEWNHVKVMFNRRNGLLQLAVNGQVVDFGYVTSNGTPNATIFLPTLKGSAPMFAELGAGFVGYLDELRVAASKDISLEMMENLSPFVRNKVSYSSSYDSKVFRLRPFSRLKKVDLIDANFNLKDAMLEVCYSKDYFLASSTSGRTCQKTQVAKAFSQLQEGFYYQLKFTFKSGDRQRLYSFAGFNLHYEVDAAPLAPQLIRVEALDDGRFLVVWNRNAEEDIAGYSLYFSRSFFSEIDDRQNRLDISINQLKQQNQTENLNLFHHYTFIDPASFSKNNIFSSGDLEGLYYFALRAYDKVDEDTGRKRQSPLSNVTSAYLQPFLKVD